MNTIQENIRAIRARMDAVALAAGRNPAEIQLCAASKMNDADRVHEAVIGGVDSLFLEAVLRTILWKIH